MFRTRSLVGVAPGRGAGGDGLRLAAPWPNPARGGVTLDYVLPAAGSVRLEIRDILGRHVATLVDAFQGAGRHLATWNGARATGHAAPPGMYYASLSCAGETRTQKILELR
jgi:hypothetical protein